MPHPRLSKKELRSTEKKARKDSRKDKRKAKFSAMKAEITTIRKDLTEFKTVTEKRYLTTVQSTVLPIVAGVISKAIYRIGFARGNHEYPFRDDRAATLLANKKKFARFGRRSEQEMEVFAATWSKTISEWNTVAHTMCGQDVIEVLPYATGDLALVLERGFELLFGIQPADWSEATIRQRLRRISA